jgi:hypothetical protein
VSFFRPVAPSPPPLALPVQRPPPWWVFCAPKLRALIPGPRKAGADSFLDDRALELAWRMRPRLRRKANSPVCPASAWFVGRRGEWGRPLPSMAAVPLVSGLGGWRPWGRRWAKTGLPRCKKDRQTSALRPDIQAQLR